ncbi:hypothetical protein JQ574_22680 [Bradyrhizobium sp. AUGA SZCCT0158]|uniref:hypothetical protein n=1 Tax=Bradyrhizobium sp. AUGA SZCCT0158 TaxID=2807661 RepID=UPI001BAA7DEC|nr:hypothetical protein [Bradyrhizobium sp. AUGA SZCCT0158]MBR1198806.1 hypothetical protein [Bradyrhizobium sp. AUGA SZCCT0158]
MKDDPERKLQRDVLLMVAGAMLCGVLSVLGFLRLYGVIEPNTIAATHPAAQARISKRTISIMPQSHARLAARSKTG